MAKRAYTFMADPELLVALKVAKEHTGFSEGLIVRLALKQWFAANRIPVNKPRKAGAKRGGRR